MSRATELRHTHAVSFVSPRPASTPTASRVMLRATASSRRMSLSGSWNQPVAAPRVPARPCLLLLPPARTAVAAPNDSNDDAPRNGSYEAAPTLAVRPYNAPETRFVPGHLCATELLTATYVDSSQRPEAAMRPVKDRLSDTPTICRHHEHFAFRRSQRFQLVLDENSYLGASWAASIRGAVLNLNQRRFHCDLTFSTRPQLGHRAGLGHAAQLPSLPQAVSIFG